MLEEAKAFLTLFGYEMRPEDEGILDKLAARATRQMLADCNIHTLPDALEHTAAEMAAGVFLAYRKAAGALGGFDAEGALKSLQEGDTTVAYYEGRSGAAQLDSLIAHLIRPRERLLARYRRMMW